MFSTPARLKERTPASGVGREDFLSQLVDEYIQTKSQDAKEQVLANLANFAYDPLNYEYMRRVGVLDIFLHVLKQETHEKLRHFACAGLCNCCLDPLNAEYIVQQDGLKSLIATLQTEHPETLADTITALIYLATDETRPVIAADSVVQTVLRLKESRDKRVSNLAMKRFKIDCKMLSNRFPYIAVNNRSYQKICKLQTSVASSPFKAGDRIRIQKTLTQKDLDAFSNLTNDYNSLHRSNGSKRAIVHGALLNGLVAGLIGTHLPGPGTVLVSQTMKFPNKCFVGEKLTISVELVEARKLLKVKFFCVVEEEKKVVFEGEAKLMMAKD